MTETEILLKQEELDRLLNDPATPLRPERVWALLEDLAPIRPEPERWAA